MEPYNVNKFDKAYVKLQIGTLHAHSQVVSIALATTLMIIITTCAAVLTTRNIESRHTFPITGIQDLKIIQPTLDFKIATLKNSFTSQIFERRIKASWRHLVEFMEPYNLGKLDEAYVKLQKGTLHAVFTRRSHLELRWKQNEHCNEDVYKLVSAFALKKGSNWKEVISTLILR